MLLTQQIARAASLGVTVAFRSAHPYGLEMRTDYGGQKRLQLFEEFFTLESVEPEHDRLLAQHLAEMIGELVI